MSNSLWFDIRDYAPDYIDNPNGGINGDDLFYNRLESANIYHHINFMIHLLWNIPYFSEDSDMATVHGRVDLLAEAMLRNLTGIVPNPPEPPMNPGRPSAWPSQFGAAARIMPSYLRQILQLDGVMGATVTELFENDTVGNARLRPIISTCFSMVGDLHDHGLDICLPFLTIQGNDASFPPLPYDDEVGNPDRRRVQPNLINMHGRNLRFGTDGEYLTLRDLYIGDSDTFHRDARRAILEFRSKGVFRPRSQNRGASIQFSAHLSDDKSRVRTGGQGNNYCCAGAPGCRHEPNYYCSYDSQNNCSAMGSQCQ